MKIARVLRWSQNSSAISYVKLTDVLQFVWMSQGYRASVLRVLEHLPRHRWREHRTYIAGHVRTCRGAVLSSYSCLVPSRMSTISAIARRQEIVRRKNRASDVNKT